MRDALRRFEAEAEVRRGRGQPAFEHLGGRKRAEGVVDLNRVELRRVVLEEALRGCALRDKSPASTWDRPSPMCRHRGGRRVATTSAGEAWEVRGKVGPQCAEIERSLGRLVGFEPTTSAATERRSATEL